MTGIFSPPVTAKQCGPLFYEGRGRPAEGKTDWCGFDAAFPARDAYLTRTEEAPAILDMIRLEDYRTEDGCHWVYLTSLMNWNDSTWPATLSAHRHSAAKLLFPTRVVRGISWTFDASLCLPDTHVYVELVEALFHVLRTLKSHATSQNVALWGAPVSLKIFPWDIHK